MTRVKLSSLGKEALRPFPCYGNVETLAGTLIPGPLQRGCVQVKWDGEEEPRLIHRDYVDLPMVEEYR